MVTQPELSSTVGTNITPRSQLPQDIPGPDVGHLATPVQDREIPHYFIAEVELRMLETGSGNSDRTISGLAFGAAIAFGVVDRTVKDLSPYNHALFVMGFWAFMLVAFYSAYRALRARAVNRSIAADVRKRKTDSTSSFITGTDDSVTMRQKIGRWISREDH